MVYETPILDILEIEDNILMLSVEDGNGNSGEGNWGDL